MWLSIKPAPDEVLELLSCMCRRVCSEDSCCCTKAEIPSPNDHGWKINNDNDEINILWLGIKPAPDEVLELLSCTCRRVCSEDSCCCMKALLKCTDMCCLHLMSMMTRYLVMMMKMLNMMTVDFLTEVFVQCTVVHST